MNTSGRVNDLTLKVIGTFQELDGEEFDTIGELIEAKGLIGSTSADVGHVELYYDNEGNTYVVAHESEKYYGKRPTIDDIVRLNGEAD